jgi:hypothetical protein
MRRAVIGILLALGLGTVILFVYFQLWRIEHRGEREFKAAHGFPNLNQVTEIEVLNREGAGVTPVIRDQATIEQIMEELRGSSRSSFDDPEISGTHYRIEMRESKEVYEFELNDLRSYGIVVSGKIYPLKGGREEVWSVSAVLIEKLLSETDSLVP